MMCHEIFLSLVLCQFRISENKIHSITRTILFLLYSQISLPVEDHQICHHNEISSTGTVRVEIMLVEIGALIGIWHNNRIVHTISHRTHDQIMARARLMIVASIGHSSSSNNDHNHQSPTHLQFRCLSQA